MKKILVSDDSAQMRRDDADVITTNSEIKKVVVIASSTGGPNALHQVIPKLPANLDAPVLLVQHMPKGFTKPFAERLDSLSAVKVVEASENDILKKGHVYVARGGNHLKVDPKNKARVYYTDEPPREGVRPCANYLFESLIDSDYEEIICVVMTGMGQDGMEGILNLSKKKKVFVITQDEETSTIYGMPKAVFKKGLSDLVVPLQMISSEIVKAVANKKL